MQAREMRRVHDGAADNAVEVHDLDRRIGVVDRIIGRPRAAIGTDGEIAEQPRLPITPVARIIGRLDPVALLEAEDPHPRIGKAPRNSGARCSRADNQHIDLVMHRIFLSRGREAILLVARSALQRKSNAQRDLVVGDRSLFDMASRLHDFEPFHIANGL